MNLNVYPTSNRARYLTNLICCYSFCLCALFATKLEAQCTIINSVDSVFCDHPKADISGVAAYTPLLSMDCIGALVYRGPNIQPISDCDSIFKMQIIHHWEVDAKPTIDLFDTVWVYNPSIDFANRFFCQGVDTLYCGIDSFETVSSGAPLPTPATAPYYVIDMDTLFFSGDDNSICKFSTAYEDDIWEFCPGNMTIKRTWTIKSQCGVDTTCTDTIVLLDTMGPIIEFDTINYPLVIHDSIGEHPTDTISVGALECLGSGLFPLPAITDACSSQDLIEVNVVAENFGSKKVYRANESPNLLFTDATIGRQIVVYKAYDACWQLSMDTFVLVVVDEAPGIAACHDAVNLTLTNVDEETFMKASSLDAGSYDNCSNQVQVFARRVDYMTACNFADSSSNVFQYYQDFARWAEDDIPCDAPDTLPFGFTTAVPFCCEDVGQSIKVEILVLDYNCNIDICWGMVNVEDKSVPLLVEELPDDTITCAAFEAFYADGVLASDTTFIQESFGAYVFAETDRGTWTLMDLNCTDSSLVSQEYRDGLIVDNCGSNLQERYTYVNADCGEAFFKRDFIASVFTERDGIVDIVIDSQFIYIVNCDANDLNTVFPTQDTTLYACGITYGPDGNILIDAGSPFITGMTSCANLGIGSWDKAFKVEVGEGCYKVSRTWCLMDWCEIEASGAMTWQEISQLPGAMVYEQRIKILDTVPPEIMINGVFTDINTQSCQASFTASVQATDTTCSGEVQVTWELRDLDQNELASGIGDTTGAPIDLAPGSYTLRWEATDECGNSSELLQPFNVNSDKKPSVSGRSVVTEINNMPPTPMASVHAKTLDAGSKPACGTDAGNLIFLVQRNSEVGEPANSDTTITFTCDDYMGANTIIQVQFWVRDTVTGNADYAVLNIELQDNMNACGDISSTSQIVEGQIMTYDQQSVEAVTVETWDGPNRMANYTTDQNGLYSVPMAYNNELRLVPFKDGDDANGITTKDLILVQRYIIGEGGFTTPYQYIAADVNNDGRISVQDVLLLRNVLLGKIPAFETNDSWRFVDAEFDFHQAFPQYGKVYPEEILINMEEESAPNFTAIKIGDLDADVLSNTSRGANLLPLRISEISFESGQKVSVPVFMKDLDLIDGLQMDWQFDNHILRFKDVKNGQLHIADANHIWDNNIRISSLSLDKKMDFNRPLFTIEFIASSAGQLSDALQLNNRSINAEVYTGDATVNLGLKFKDNLERGFFVSQNRPNPFAEQTFIDVQMPQSGNVDVSLYDVSGRLVFNKTAYLEAGLQTIELSNAELLPGMLTYTITSQFGKVSRRMMVMND